MALGQAQQLWTTGPAIAYVGVGGALGADVPVQFGTAEARPTIVTYDEWLDAYNDLGGVKIPFDDSFQGEFALIRLDVTRWDEDVLRRIQARPSFTGTRGFFPFGTIGALMKTERLYYPLWLKFSYQSKAAYSNMPAGYRFPVSWLLSPEEMPVGTIPRKVSCIFISRMIFNPVDGSHFLYDENMTGLPSLS
jgi:hypothetical protein